LRIKVELISENKITLPTGYNSIIQGLIYNFFDKNTAKWLHNTGFAYEKRKFKMFSFSPFLERASFDKINKTFTFPQNISFYFSSPVDWLIEQFATNFIKQDFIQINSQKAYINSVNVLKNPEISKNSIKIRAITPIEVHSTLKKENGKKLTHYYTPFDKEFKELINANLKKKWHSLFNKECTFNISIEPLFTGNKFERIQYFGTNKDRRTLIKGWKGYYQLDGELEFLKFAYSAGLGSRNSAGFGMWEVMYEKKLQVASSRLQETSSKLQVERN